MTTPSTFLPLVTRVYEVLCLGLGDSRTIARGRFKARLFPGQDVSDQHKQSLIAGATSPNRIGGIVTAIVESFSDGGTQEFSSTAQLEARLRVDVAYAVDNAAARSALGASPDLATQALTQAASDAHDVRRALCWPPNMLATSGGDATGAAGGGGLLFQSFGPVRYDPAGQLVTATLYFRAIVFLAL